MNLNSILSLVGLTFLLQSGTTRAQQPAAADPPPVSVSLQHYDLQDLHGRLQSELGLQDEQADQWVVQQVRAQLNATPDTAPDAEGTPQRKGLLGIETEDGRALNLEVNAQQRAVQVDGKTLYVLAERKEHQRIQELLQTLEQMGIRQIVVSAHVFRDDVSVIKRLPIRWSHIESAAQVAATNPSSAIQPASYTQSQQATVAARYLERKRGLPPEKLDAPEGVTAANWTEATSIVERATPVLYTLLAPEEYDAVLAEAKQLDSLEHIMKPKVVVFNKQVAAISNSVERPFVTGIKPMIVKPSVGAQQVKLAPQIRVYPEGTRMNILPELLDGERVRLNYELRLSKIRGVETLAIPGLVNDEEFVVQMPEVATTQFRTCIDLPVNYTLAVSSYQTDAQGRQQAIVVLCHCAVRDVAQFRSATTKPAPSASAN